MKNCILFFFFLLTFLKSTAQYYLRGQIFNEKNEPLQNVKIFVYSSRAIYKTGNNGDFGISTNILMDSVLLSTEGYESKVIKTNANQFQNIQLKILSNTINRNRLRLISATKNLKQSDKKNLASDNESYFELVENQFVDANMYATTGFSLNVNKASYSNSRRFINMQSEVPPDAVRTEELLNYFNLHYSEPKNPNLFNISSQLTQCPWDTLKQLLILNISAKKLDLNKIPPSNFVFLIDVSGSMDMPNRLPMLKAAFQLFVKNLRPIDTMSIVTYGGGVSIKLPPTSGTEKEKIITAIEELTAIGDTPGEAAIITAYSLATHSYIKNGINRVILATDGDFNVGQTSEAALDELITKQRQSGVYLTCLGVGMGNFKDSKLETLAKRGNGNFAYLDDYEEAEKVLIKELTQTFYSVADNVFMNLQFNPNLVKRYRLIGYDNKKNALSDSTLNLEGGEVGSGSSINAFFEIEPTKTNINNDNINLIAQANLQYNKPNDTSKVNIKYNCTNNFKPFLNIDNEWKLATSIALFGLKLKQSNYIKNVDWSFIQLMAANSYDPSNYLQTQLLNLIKSAEKVYNPKLKKRFKKNKFKKAK